MGNQSFDTMTDEEVVTLAQNGSEEACEYMLRKYGALVSMKASSYFLAGGDRKDLVQEGLIGLYKAVKDYNSDKDASFKSFADLCITRQLISAVKASLRQKHFPLNFYISLDKTRSEEGNDASLMDIIASDETSNPETIVIGKESMEMVSVKMEELLSTFECKVLALYLKGKSYGEIASALHKEPKSIDNALQRIKKKFEKFSDEF